jgi:hypothetical protein
MLYKSNSIIEARLTFNGISSASLCAADRLCNVMANKNTGIFPPSDDDKEMLRSYTTGDAVSSAATFRAKVANDAMARYERGVPICNTTRNTFIQDLKTKATSLNAALLPPLIDRQGKIDNGRLKAALPAIIRNNWPTLYNGDLCLKEITLQGLDDQYAKHLLTLRKLHAGTTLNAMVVDADNRHRFYPNPFGTSTGREKPYGPALMYLPKCYRTIIKPEAGKVVVSFDFQQQEPAILACLANDTELMALYQTGDIYQHIAQQGPWSALSRSDVKSMVISFLYGADDFTLSTTLRVSKAVAREWLRQLRDIFKMHLRWQDLYAHKAYQTNNVSCLDWAMHVGTHTKIRTLKNWPVQAAGADILRRACLALAQAKIDVIFCQHDSIMVEIDAVNYEQTCARVQQLMTDASAKVLSGFRLKTVMDYEAHPASDLSKDMDGEY